MPCYLTRTGAFLPGEAVANADISRYLGTLAGEHRVKRTILAVNGIKKRHYALDQQQRPTHDVYQLATLAAQDCLAGEAATYLSAGSTNTPLVGPGISSRLHSHLAEAGLLPEPLEINSNSGICTSGAQAFVNAYRAVSLGEHRHALCVGVEQPSAILKSKAIRPTYDLPTMWKNIRRSKWFMSVFLRFMLSDGAGAFLLSEQPAGDGLSFKVDWTFSRSFAHKAPLCMTLESGKLLLSQDIEILSEHMMPCAREAVTAAFAQHQERLENYKVVLPHLSSYYFLRGMMGLFRELCDGKKVAHWTNLSRAGNTGAASIYIMLDEFLRTQEVEEGDRLLLFIPESGQFNFVLISLTAVAS